jgi:2'-5' RNA ligase superfamily protein
MAGALIVTAAIAERDLAWLDRLRLANYPRERNLVRAHLTMFHALPPSAEPEVRARLVEFARRPAPKASIEGLIDLGGGVAFRIVSPELDRIRDQLAASLHGLLGAQDLGGWRPHVTIQNKVEPKVARALKQSLEDGFIARPLAIRGLALDRYLGGLWEFLGLYSFRGLR